MSILSTRSVIVRRADPGDDAIVTTLFHALHTFNASLDRRFMLADGWESVLAEHLAHERRHEHGATFLAYSGGCPAGLLMMDAHTDSPLFQRRHWAEILALYVVPDQRGEGVADRLIDEGLSWTRDHGLARIQLYVTATNVRAKRFYSRAEFGPIQEIWCRDLDVATGEPPADIACESAYAHGHHLLSGNQHHLTVDDEPCDEAVSREP